MTSPGGDQGGRSCVNALGAILGWLPPGRKTGQKGLRNYTFWVIRGRGGWVTPQDSDGGVDWKDANGVIRTVGLHAAPPPEEGARGQVKRALRSSLGQLPSPFPCPQHSAISHPVPVPSHGQTTRPWLSDCPRLARKRRGQGVPDLHPAQEPPAGVR